MLAKILLLDKNNVFSDDVLVPFETALYPVYPNPFNATAAIAFKLSMPGEVNIRVYNVSGQEVIQYSEEYSTAGCNSILINGEQLSSGIYINSG